MKKENPIHMRKDAVPLIIIVAVAFMSTGGFLGYLVGGAGSTIKGVAYGIGIVLILGLLILPNVNGIIRWMKGIKCEINKK